MDDRHDMYLARLAETGQKFASAKALAVPYKELKEWRKEPAFKEAEAEALEEFRQDSKEKIFSEAMRRAVHGWDEPVIFRGALCPKNPDGPLFSGGEEEFLTVRKYSDPILVRLLNLLVQETNDPENKTPAEIKINLVSHDGKSDS